MDESGRTPVGGESSSPNNQQPPPPPPGPTSQNPEMVHPQPPTVIGYPTTAMGYPASEQRGIPPQYPGYPNASNYNQTPYMQSQPQPETYYTYQTYTSSNNNNMVLVRALLLLMMLLVFFTCISSVIMYFVARNQVPIFRMASFSVSNFNVSTDRFSSVWETNITMENRFRSADFHFEHAQGYVYFEDHLLASSPVAHYDAITIRRSEKGTLPAKVTVNDSKQITPEPEKKAIDDLRSQRKNGSLNFSFKIFLWTTVTESYWRTRHWKIGILCRDVKIEFENQESSKGNYKGNSKDCDSLF